jgi:hypothetical protein
MTAAQVLQSSLEGTRTGLTANYSWAKSQQTLSSVLYMQAYAAIIRDLPGSTP